MLEPAWYRDSTPKLEHEVILLQNPEHSLYEQNLFFFFCVRFLLYSADCRVKKIVRWRAWKNSRYWMVVIALLLDFLVWTLMFLTMPPSTTAVQDV